MGRVISAVLVVSCTATPCANAPEPQPQLCQAYCASIRACDPNAGNEDLSITDEHCEDDCRKLLTGTDHGVSSFSLGMQCVIEATGCNDVMSCTDRKCE